MKTKILALAISAAVLAACSSSKDASNSNFEKVLNSHYTRDCITIQPFIISDDHAYPMTVQLQAKNAFVTQAQIDQNNANTTRPLDVLAKAGVLSVSEGTKKVKPMFGDADVTVPTKVYTLTDAGKKAIVGPDSTAMCVGHYKVDEVIRFTPPNNAMGQTISEVSFTVSPVDVPDWTKSPNVQTAFGLESKLADHTKATRTVVLASDGWIDANDFSK